MSTLTERVARAICTSADCCGGECSDRVAQARAAIREVRAAMRQPSEAMLAAVAAGKPWIGHPEARPESVARYHEGVRRAAVADMATMLDAFAREHGLAPPPAEEQQP